MVSVVVLSKLATDKLIRLLDIFELFLCLHISIDTLITIVLHEIWLMINAS